MRPGLEEWFKEETAALSGNEGTRMSTVEVDLTNFFGNNVCDTCGEKATHAVRNKGEEPNSSVRRFTYGPWRFGCDNHKKRQITKYLDGTLEQAA